MSRIGNLVEIIKQAKELLPLIKEVIECFRELQPTDQQRLLQIVGGRSDKATVEALAVIANIPSDVSAPVIESLSAGTEAPNDS